MSGLMCLCCLSVTYAYGKGIPEPYRYLSGSFHGEQLRYSPDPLSSCIWDNIPEDTSLEIYRLYPVAVSCDNGNASWTHPGGTVSAAGDCSIMLDFGQVNAGWLEFTCDRLPEGTVCSISEFNEPAVFNTGAEHPVKTAAPVRYGNKYRLELNRELYEGVRYAWIHLRGVVSEVKIKDISLVCQTRPVNYLGAFECNDTTLNRIWYTAAYTVRLNLLQDYFGAILMERSDRHSWTGDAHTSQAASLVAFGNYGFVRKNLYYTSAQYNGIASYSLYWVQSLLDYLDYSGDIVTFMDLVPEACRKLDEAYRHFYSLPSLVFYGWDERLGAGFESPDNEETRMAYRMLCIGCWRRFSEALSRYGEDSASGRYAGWADEKTAELTSRPDWYSGLDIFALSDAVNAGAVSSHDMDEIWKEAFSDRVHRVSYSPFNQYFVMNAMSAMGRYAEALNTVDDCWGGQIRYGATTFFEVFCPSWNISKVALNDAPVNNQCGYTSLTHPWSSGILKWLSEEILGIRPLAPGFSMFSVRPNLAGDVDMVKGKVPTPHGIIEFSIDADSGDGSIYVPEGCCAMFSLPLMGASSADLSIDGNVMEIYSSGTHASPVAISPGRHSFRFSYNGRKSCRMDEVFAYDIPAGEFSEDGVTGGNWAGSYGQEGYVLFGGGPDGADIVKLPSGCRSVEVNKAVRKASFNIDAVSQNSLLRICPDVSGTAGAIETGDPVPCWQTMTVDVDYRGKERMIVSLYMLDDEGDRRSAVELYGLDDRRILAPVHIVRDYSGGKYVSFPVDRPVRIRICQIRGRNASCSGIFFDTMQ